jgi:hypothetical protein
MLCLSCCIAAYAGSHAQDTTAPSKPTAAPEKVMAARLQNVVPLTVSKPPLANKCSNAMVMLKLDIDETGKVRDATFDSGFDELREPSLAAVKQWTYKPYEQNGKAIPVETRVAIFYLGDGESFPMYSPDGKGGVKGGNLLPLPPGCGPGPTIRRPPE